MASTTCEPSRTSAYDEDLRWRIVWQSEILEYSQEVIAQNLNIHQSTVSRTLHLFNTTGSVRKRPYPKERAFRKLTDSCQLLIYHLVVQRPGIYLHEIQSELLNVLLVDVSIATICRFLHESGFTRQRLKHVALQQDALLRELYVSDVSLFSTDMFVFVDETGTDRRNLLRKYGYSLRNKPAVNHSLLARGERISAIACMSVSGILDVKTVQGTCNGDTFYDFVHTHLMPHLMPFNGTNPHSIVVLDNCSIHCIDEVKEMLQGIGVLVFYLPPYSPDMNPIEEAFAKVKSELRAHDGSEIDLETLIHICFAAITSEDCRGWVEHSGIYNQSL